MKTLTVFFVLAVLFTLTGCITQEIQVTRIVKETVVEPVEVTPVFDAGAEKEAVPAFDTAWTDARENGDREATRALLGEDWAFFISLPDWYHVWTPRDETPDWWTDPEFNRWDYYEDFVSTDLVVRRGFATLNYNTDPVRVFITSVLRKENGEWKLLHSHISYGGE
jgi:hypothetical protein